MKFRRGRALASLALTATVLSGCTSGGHKVVGSSPVNRVTVLDGGSLTVSRVTGAGHPAVSRQQAARVLAATQLPVNGPLVPELAKVSAHLRAYDPRHPAASLDVALAWVYLVTQPTGASHCSGAAGGFGTAPTPPASPPPSRTWVVFVDATSGRGYVYQGVGAGLCSPGSVPVLRPAVLRVSVRFALRRLTPLAYQETVYLPPCGTFESGSFGPHFNVAIATVPAGPCDQRSTIRTITGAGRVPLHPHGGLGLVCQGVYDAKVGKPSDCAVSTS